MFDFKFDAAQHTGNNIDALPAGTYNVIATNAEPKYSKSGGSWYIAFEFAVNVTNSDLNGRKIWYKCHVGNINPTAQQIALNELGDLCRAVDVPTLSEDLSPLLGKLLTVKVDIDSSEQYGDRNEIKRFLKYTGAGTPNPDDNRPAWSL